ncbi:MAG: hypothetical protein R3C14_54540 [Caldilineaceae bacterium]
MIELKQTETEYLLSIHASQKERAKSVNGWRWVPERRCWVYPRNARTYDALIAEFGDDLVSLSVTRPAHAIDAATQAADLQKENVSLKDDLRQIQQQIAQISEKQSDSIVGDLKKSLLESESELAVIKYKLQEQEKVLNEKAIACANASEKIVQLRKQLQSLQSANNFEKLIKGAAKGATGGEHKFELLVDSLNLNETLPISLVSKLEEELRLMLNLSDPGLRLHDLLVQARDAELLPQDALDLAHIIRKQRNLLAHGSVYNKTHEARILLCLFAAALLWPELPE